MRRRNRRKFPIEFSTARFPIIRMPAIVHHGGNYHRVAFHGVDDSVGEASSAAFSVTFRNFGPGLWVTQNPGDGSLDFIEEFQSQSRHGAVLVIGGFRKLACRR